MLNSTRVRRPSRIRFLLIVSVVISAMIAILFAALWAGCLFWATAKLNQARALAKANGADYALLLETTEDVKVSDDGSELLERAEQLWEGVRHSKDWVLDSKNRPTAEAMNTQAGRDILDLLLKASLKSRILPRRDYSMGPAVDAGPLLVSLAGARGLVGLAVAYAKQGDTGQAAEMLGASSKISEMWMSDTLVLGWATGAAINGVVFHGAQEVFSAVEVDRLKAGWGKILENRLEARDLRGSAARAIAFDAAVMDRYISENGIIADQLSYSERSRRGVARWSDFFRATLFRPFLLLDQALFLEEVTRLAREVRDGPIGPKRVGIKPPRWATFSKLTLPAYDSTGTIARIAETQRHLMKIGIRLEEWKASNGTYPASLRDLGEGLDFVDPFGGLDFKYKQSGGLLVLYSIGPDGVDNGGRSMAGPKKRGDIVWEVRRSH
jgi:hypothetical protein